MNTRRLFTSLAIALALTFTLALWSQEAPPRPVEPADPGAIDAPTPAPAPTPAADAEPPLREITVEQPAAVEAVPPIPSPAAPPAKSSTRKRPVVAASGDAMVVFNQDAFLEKGSRRDAVVSIGGSSTAEGDVADAVVSILGDTRVEGLVGDAAVSIIGNTTINGEVEVAVAVLGGVELGPNAVVHNVVSIGGPIRKAPGARITGEAQEVGFLQHMPNFTGFRAWIRHALFLGRPLAIADHLGWAWGVAAAFLGLYLLLAALFPTAVERCAQTVQERPGRTVLASLICMVLTPIFLVLLTVTVVGPFLAGMALTLATFIGKAALLAWMGRRLLFGLMEGSRAGTVLAVAVGGALLTVVYLIPVVGLVVWKVSGILALGVAVYTVILSNRRSRPSAPPTGGATAGPGRPPVAPAPGNPFVASPTVSATPLASTYGDLSAAAAPSGVVTGAWAEPVTEATVPPMPSAAAAEGAFTTPANPVDSVPLSAMPRAGFWIRMGALAIDVIVVGAIAGVMSLGSLFLLLLAAYGAVMWKLRATTIGGIVCGLKVVRLDERPVDWATAVVRALASFLSLFAGGLGFIWIAVDRDRQSWHDKIAGTAVVQLPQGTPLV